MQFAFNLLSEQTVLMVLQLLVGRWMKSNEKISRELINWMTLGLSIMGYSVMPASANAAGFLAPAAPAVGIFVAAIFQSLLVTGVHSTFKNSVGPALKRGAIKLLELMVGRETDGH